MFFTKLCKRILVLVFIANATYSACAQSVDIGIKGALSSAWFYNANIFKGGTNQGYYPTLSHDMGFCGAINFTYNCGLEMEVNDATLNEGYSGTYNNEGEFPVNGIDYQKGQKYHSETQINVLQIPIMFRYEKAENGKYFETGLGYEVINSAEYSATYTNPSFSVNENIISHFPASDFLAIIGFGWDKKVRHDSKFYFKFGFRLYYGLFDLGGVDGHGQELTGPRSTILYQYTDSYYGNYHGTHLLEVSANMGIFYRLFPKALIHKRKMNF